MQRTSVNPWPWSVKLGYDQGQVLAGATRHLTCSGQTAVDAQGHPQHVGKMRAQIGLALDNLEAVLAAAGMSLVNLTRIAIYTTDMDATLQNFDVIGARLGSAGVAPPMTLVGVTRLALPALMIEIEASAAD
jgi:enamine deaminase RidA (YjgF/YER057c/UK114 family)